MNRRDYSTLVKIVKRLEPGIFSLNARKRVVDIMASEIEAADGCASFDRAKFEKACGVAP